MVDRNTPTKWSQLSMLPPPVVEICFKVGVIRDENHVQAQIEVTDATTGGLIGLVSWPHFSLPDFEERMREIGTVLTETLREHTGPF